VLATVIVVSPDGDKTITEMKLEVPKDTAVGDLAIIPQPNGTTMGMAVTSVKKSCTDGTVTVTVKMPSPLEH